MVQLKKERPYQRESIKNLEQIFKAHDFNKKVLRALNVELRQRTTKNAELLRGRVLAQLVEIRNREQFWRNKDVKNKTEKKVKPQRGQQAKPQTETPQKLILTNPVQPVKQEQATLPEKAKSKLAAPEPVNLDACVKAESLRHVHPPLTHVASKRRWQIGLAVSVLIGIGLFFLWQGGVSNPHLVATPASNVEKTIIEKMIAEDAAKKLAGEPVAYQEGPYGILRVRGLSDAQIREFMRPLLLRSGFSSQQVGEYFRIFDPLYIEDKDPDVLAREHWKMIENILN